MNRFLLVLVVCSLGLSNGYSQESLNDYKYIIVPNRYDFFDEADKYRLNALTKFLFKKNGFEALMADQPYPEDLKNDGCLGLRANVINLKGMLKTRLEVELRDCSNTLVYKTKIGISREKQFKTAYNLALRDAFTSFNSFNYKYNGKVPQTSGIKVESETTNIEMKPVKEMKEIKVEKPEIKAIKKPIEKEVSSESKKELKKVETVKKVIDENIFTTREIFNGFKLLDSSEKEVMTVFDSGVKDVFIVKGKDAIIYKKGEAWIYSETNETNLLTKLIKIKF